MRVRAISKHLRALSDFAAGSYIAGTEIEAALRAVNRVNSLGYLSTICPWDKVSDSKALVNERYRSALDAIIQTKSDTYLSIKAPSIDYDRKLIQVLVEQASSAGVRIHFDSLSPQSVDPTFDLVRDLYPVYKNLGVTLPACWRRSIDDAHEMIELGVAIRVVKGQWSDGTVSDGKVSAAFLEIIDSLAGKAPLVAVASHDSDLVKEALEIMRRKAAVGELEQLYGLPFHCGKHAFRLNYKIRVYIPYGTGYLPYAASQIYKNPMIGWWLTRDLIRSTAIRFSGVIFR